MKKAIRILAIIYISYLLLVLLVITPALNLLPAWLIKKHLGREFHSEMIWFNPFTVSLEVRKTELPELDGTPFLSLDRATVDLSMSSLWSGALVFDELRVDELYAHVEEKSDGNFNFSDMLPPPEPAAPVEEAGEIVAVTIDHLALNSREIVYTRPVGGKPTSTSLSGIAIVIDGLSTVLEEGRPYTLDASGERGGLLQGTVSIPRSLSEGSLTLTRIQLSPLWRFIEPWVELELTDGTFSLAGQYKIDWSSGFDYWINQGEASLEGIAIRPKTPAELPDTDLALGSLKLAGIELDGPAQRVAVDSLAIREIAVRGWSEGEDVSLARLFEMNFPAAAEQLAEEEAETATKDWNASLGSLKLTDSSVHWRSEFTDPAELEITPLELSANALKWPLEGDTALTATLTVNGQTSASVEGDLDLAQGVGKLTYQLQALPLPWFNPNLPAALKARITEGQLQVAGEITLDQFMPGTIAMDGAINGFAGKITDAEQSITSWETVRWEKLLIDMDKHRVGLAKLSIDNYNGRIHIHKDGSINAQKVWQQEVGEQAEEVKDSLAEGAPWVVDAPLIRISDSEIDFMDESLPIPFRTVISDIDGNIVDISTTPGTKTKVDIKGSVDGYAPVALVGSAEPLRSPPAIDLDLSFAGVDMALLSPYSGTYAGYAIERGVLNLDLNYAMEDNRLKGRNKIVIEQMKLGEKIKSEKAVDVPLELALALLTDSNGVIDMDIPVSGNVEDPEFNVGSVVMGALVNMITKIVTSPFTLLASLVDSEQDLQRINFKSGSAELGTASREKLDKLVTALNQRPELNLVITGRLQLKADRVRLQKNLLQEELLAAGLPQDELSSKGPEWEKLIVERYQEMVPGATGLTVNDQYLKLAQNIPLPDTALLELATARAVAVKTYLVTDAGLSPERAAIAKPKLDAKVNLYSGAELEIDT